MSRQPRHLMFAALGAALGLAALPAARASAQPAGLPAGQPTAETVDPGQVATAADIAAAEAAAAARPTSPLQAEVAALRAAFSAGLDELTARYHAAPDAAAAAEAQRAISAHKQQLELDLLDLQLRLARERRDADAIAELEGARAAASERLAADTGRELPEQPTVDDEAKERQP